MAPIKKIQIRKNYAPWLSDTTKELIKERNEAQKVAFTSKKLEDWEKFKKLRNNLTSRLKHEKENWQQRKLENCDSNSGKIWDSVKGWLNWTSSGAPTQIFYNGKLENKSLSIAECMNKFFIEKIKTIQTGMLQIIGTDPLATLKALMKNRSCVFKMKAVHPDTVDKIISTMKNSKASGLDNIDTYILKLAKQEIVPAITHIVNLSIEQGVFPEKFKYAKVIPLHKKDDWLNPKNFRPVSILSNLSKIVERAVFLQLIEYLNEKNLLHPNHHGFRSNVNTTTALIQMYDSWIEALERGDVTVVCLLDMSAAFDLVDFSLLLRKMKLYGLDDNALKWMENYLTGRKQCVCIDGILSTFLNVDTGVPQGSILGPLLYVIFTNDLPEIIHDHGPVDNPPNEHSYNVHCIECGGLCCFADDSTYSISGKTANEISQKIATKYEIISEYMQLNRLKLNDDKTHLMVMMTDQLKRKRPDFVVNLNTGTDLIKPTGNEKMLGGIISSNLKWTCLLYTSDAARRRG